MRSWGMRGLGVMGLAVGLGLVAMGFSSEGLKSSGSELLDLPEMKADQQVSVGAAIPIQPSGYAVRIGKAVHGILDVAAPLDAGTGAAVPGIIKPDQPAKPTVHIHAAKGEPTYVDYHYPQPQPNVAFAIPNVQPSAPVATQSFSQRSPKMGVELKQGAKQQQLAEMEDDDSMYPMTEAESWAAEPAPEYHYVVQHQADYVERPSPAPPAADVAAVVPAQKPQVVPNYFKAPFGEWTREDSAQHAYDLAQWRVRILQAKLKQAELRSALMKESKKQTSGDHHRGRRGRYAARESRNARRARLLYQSMDKMSQDTSKTLKGIEHQILALARIEKKKARREGGVSSAMKQQAYEDYSQHEMDKFKKRTKHTLKAIMKKLSAIQKKVAWEHDPARDAGALETSSTPVSEGVRDQEQLWKKVSSDLS